MAHRIRLSAAGLLVSKPGANCLSGTYDDQLFDGTRRNTRACMSGSLSTWTGTYVDQSHGGYRYRYQIPHNLGYVPHCNFQQRGTSKVNGITVDGTNVNIWVLTASNAGPSVQFGGSSGAYIIDYTVFYDRLI